MEAPGVGQCQKVSGSVVDGSLNLGLVKRALEKEKKKDAHAVDISEGVIELYNAIDGLLSTSLPFSILARWNCDRATLLTNRWL